MKNYLEACDLPLAEIGGTLAPKLILGHLPFIGESYQGLNRNCAYMEKFSKAENITTVVGRAVTNYGATVMAALPASEGDAASRFLEALRLAQRRLEVEIALIPCLRIPLTIRGKPVDDYRRWLTYYHIEKENAGEEILRGYLEDPILQCREGWRIRFTDALNRLQPYGKQEIEELKIQLELIGEAVSTLKGFRLLFLEPGSETDFLVAVGRLDLLGGLLDWLQDNFSLPVLLGVHHAGLTIPALERSGLNFAGYLAPVNRLGVMMFPTQRLALEAVRAARKPIIAIKPLAGGRIPPREALDYVYHSGVSACMVGVASEVEVDECLSAALSAFSR